MSTTDDKPASRIVGTLSEPQTARAKMRAGRSFEAEASVTVTPMGLLAVGGLMAAILLSTATIVRATRRRVFKQGAPAQPVLVQQDEMRRLPASPPTGDS